MNVLDAVFSVSPDLYFQFNADGVITAYHALASQELYVPPDQFLGRRVQDVLPEDIGQQLFHAIQEAIRTQRPVTVDYQLRVNSGWQHYEARFLTYAPQQAIAIVHNITARKRA